MKRTVSTRKMVQASVFAALTFVATLIHIHVPGMQTGYVNLGDCLVIVSGILLGPIYGSMAAGIGSALTDLLHGYAMYVLPTFVIKALMAATVYFLYYKLFRGKNNYSALPMAVAAVFAEIIMIGGYFLYEGLFMVGFAGAAAGIPGNCIQALAAVVFAPILLQVLKKTSVTKLIDSQ